MNIHERDDNKQEDLNILLEKIYLYLRYGEIEKAFDVLDEAIDENKNHYEYLVEKIKLLYMLYLKEEAYEVLDANVELLYSNIDKIDVDFISRRIYYHFYRNIELDSSSTGNNFDYLKITKEFINKYGFREEDEKEISSQEKNVCSASLNEENVDIVESFSASGDYNLFGEAITLEDELDSFEVVAENESSEYLQLETTDIVDVDDVNNEANIFEELFAVEVIVEEQKTNMEVASENAAEQIPAEEVCETIFYDEAESESTTIDELEQEVTEEAASENVAEQIPAEEVCETIFYDEAESESTTIDELEQEDRETIFAEEVAIEQEAPEEEDIVIEDNPHIDQPIYLGKVNGKDVFFESMAEHLGPAKEEKPIIIIDSSQYTFTRLISLLILGFVIGAAIVYYL